MSLKRITDIAAVICALSVLLVPMLIVALAVRITSPGPILHYSGRVGRNGKLFQMPKFRTMREGTPAMASDELTNVRDHLTPIGLILRKSSLDEIPQLWCILKGDMTLVGPRPALFNQSNLIALRERNGIDRLTPGLTGWAQINGRDALTDAEKVALDKQYLKRQSWFFDMKILVLTIPKVLGGSNIRH